MKEAPIKHSPYAFDYDAIMKMSEAERSKLYTTNKNTDFKPYTVIDVLKKVFHRDFVDDLMYSLDRERRSLEAFRQSDDDRTIVQYWVETFDVIRPESVFGQPVYDHLVDIYVEVGIRVLEMDSYGERNIYFTKRRLRLRYTFDFRPCHMTCLYLGLVLGEDFGVHSIYKNYFRTDKYLLPWLTSQNDYERMARMILEQDMPGQVDSDDWLCAIDWIHSMGLGVYIGEFDEPDVMGEYFYGFGRARVYDPEDGKTKMEDIDPGTILLNRKTLDSRGKINSTACHEGIHYRLGTTYFLLQMMHGQPFSSYLCKQNENMGGITEWTPSQIMELHANKLPAYILIQEKPGKAKAKELFDSYGGERRIENMVRLVNDMAEYFGVTKTIARSRLFEFGYRDVGGVSQYIRGRYIAPYLNNLGKNQSYCIDEQSALQEYISNPLFRRIIDRGNYEYVNGHYCLRDSKYIGINSKGEKFLTIYAREHMAECCLVFECRHEKMSVSLSGGAIRKTGVSSKKLVYTDKNGKSLVTAEGLATRKKVLQMMEERAIAEKSFNQMTVDLMTAKGITVEGLADKTGLSEQTIKNMRNDPNKNIGIEAVLAVSIAMNLTPETRELYIDKSPNKWRNTEDMSICRFLMGSCGSMSVADFNRKLLECGSAPLTPLIAGFNEDVFLRPRTEMIS